MKLSEILQKIQKCQNSYFRAFAKKIRKILPLRLLFFAKNKNYFKQTRSEFFGLDAERAAADYLKREKHLKILARNYRTGRLEIDIVAFDKRQNSLVFVEVKSRGVHRETDACLAATDVSKRLNIKKAAKRYVAEMKNKPASLGIRYDIVIATHNPNGEILSLRHFQNVGFARQKRGRLL